MGGEVTGSAAVVRPWNDGWQLWSRKRGARSWECLPLDSLAVACDLNRVTCAVAARMVVSACFWVESGDIQIVRDIAALEIEVRGIAARDRVAQDANIHILIVQEQRTLVRVEVFPPDWPDALRELTGRRYEASPSLAVLADQSVHLWREGDDLVAALTWKGELLCWETMHWSLDPAEIGAWLRCLILQQTREIGIAQELLLKCWNSQISLPEGFAPGRALSEKDLEEGPQLSLPQHQSGWLPPIRRQEEIAGKRRRSMLAVLSGIGAVVLAVVGAVGFVIWNSDRQIRLLDVQIERDEAVAAPIRDVAERWRRVEPAVNPRYFPIEILHHVVAVIPESVRLTVFEMTPESVLIEGEAKNVSAATDFLAKIQKSEEIQWLAWEMPPPSLQSNNTARFVINGTRVDAEE